MWRFHRLKNEKDTLKLSIQLLKTKLSKWLQWGSVSEGGTQSSMTVSSETAVSEHHTQSSITVSSEDADVEGDTQSSITECSEDSDNKDDT